MAWQKTTEPTGVIAQAGFDYMVDPTTGASTFMKQQVTPTAQITSDVKPTPAPQVAPPSAANGFGTGIVPVTPTLSEADTLRKSLYDTSQTTQTPEQIRQDKLKQFQQEIDAINNIYSGILSQAKVAGVGRLGQERAMASRGGRIGSAMGAAQQSNVEAQNLGIEQSIQAEQAAKVASVLGEANSKADQEIALQREAKQQGAEAYLKYLDTADEKKKTNAGVVLQSLLGQGVKLEDLTQDEYNQLQSSLGLSPKDFNTIYKGEVKKIDETNAAASRDFAIKNNITSPLYTLDGKTIYDTMTGKQIDPQQYIANGGDPSVIPQQVRKPVTKEDLIGSEGGGYYQIMPDGTAKQVIPPANKLKYQKIGGTTKAPVYGFVDDQGNIYDANKNPLQGNQVPQYSSGGGSVPSSPKQSVPVSDIPTSKSGMEAYAKDAFAKQFELQITHPPGFLDELFNSAKQDIGNKFTDAQIKSMINSAYQNGKSYVSPEDIKSWGG